MTERTPAPILHMKYRRFCAEYLKDFDGQRAAEACSLDPRRVSALLRNWRIVTTLAEMSQKILDQPMEIAKMRLKNEYEHIGYSRSEYETKDRLTALGQLAKYTGLVSDAKKLELTGKDGAPIQFIFPE